MLKANAMFLSLVVLVSLNNATITVKDTNGAYTAPAVVGKASTPTPEGMYLLEKAYSTKLKMHMLVFKQEGNAVYAIHPNLAKRSAQINSASGRDNYLSAGCIGVRQKDFDKLWAQKQPLVLQVY